MTELERHSYDVVVIGAGGAGLRAAIEAREQGKKTAIICKSLFGKAHTVMAEGGCAAAMGNANSNDNWQTHYRDTMRGGKFLNNWRMAELHAQEAPDRVWELETYGALFDRTPDGKISQRNFGGHTYPRLAHVGDRTGLELIRTLQQKIVSLQQEDFEKTGDYEANLKVYAECTITELLKDGDAISGAFGYWRESGRFIMFDAPAVILATGGVGKSFKVTSNSWEYTGDGHALAMRAGATLINMEFIQFHPTGMVWPPSVKGILVTESVRGDGGVLKNSEGKRFMFEYVPDVFRAQYADTEEEADRWYKDADNNRRPPELLPRDEVARAINSEVKAGRGTPHGGVFLDVSTRLPAEEITRRLPSMHHQFKELADVDITKEPMEVGPTCHYVMGGVEVDPDTASSVVPGLFAAGEVAGGMHGSNRLGGNSLSDLLVFGRRAGMGASTYVDSLKERPKIDEADIDAARGGSAGAVRARGWREPVHDPPGAPAVDERPGRHHPQGGRDGAGARPAGRVPRPDREDDGGGSPAVQPGLAPGARPAEHADRVGVRGGRRAAAAGVPRRSHPGRLPGDERRVAQEAAGLRARLRRLGERHRGAADPDARGPARAVRGRRTVEVPDRRGAAEHMSYKGKFRVWRGDSDGGELKDYEVEVNEGEVVLDVIHRLQATQTPDMAVRWNCKAGKCGSCSAEINGMPKLMCMCRMNTFEEDEVVTVTPMRTFPVIRDLVTDVSYNYQKAREVPAFKPPADLKPGEYRMQQEDVERSQEFRKCIECFLCQDTCHVIRDHEENKENFSGPRFLMRIAELDMHPLDAADRQNAAQEQHGLGFCNITKCCTEVCPEHIKITDNALIPMKERVADRKYDPLVWLGNKIRRRA
ncbi:succinate dehydrogenase/fumarate reductase iron-sulfur protein [Kribbella aluminosa]|uniref:Succinate dehydrogenase/fumarate reductase iron-sulfur protein n=2 Tax=Kribbella aluminosa TaxID=416017 RepID=A0ABS4UF96_9ACTN|nr:succinate dehydrogenase/fumarate reductase iron-sulfur protein [Kribbella aluminosa]